MPTGQEEADIVVAPGLLQFSELATGDVEDLTFSIRNVGGAPLDVQELRLVGAAAFEVVDAEASFTIAAGGEREVRVRFSPLGVEDRGTVEVLSNDEDTPVAEVALIGTGQVPSLAVSPSNYTFSDARIGCIEELDLSFANQGNLDLEITGFDYVADPTFTLAAGPALPYVLGPGESTLVTIQFAPIDDATSRATLEVASNDPAGARVVVHEGVGAHAEPVTEVYTELGLAPVDILVLVDRSCSMEDDNTDDVRLGFPAMIDGLVDVDWQLALVNDQDGCAVGGIATPSFPNVGAALAAAAFSGGLPDYETTESLLLLAERALSKTVVGGCNEGLLRPGASLEILVMSDEREQSGQSGTYWVGEMESYLSDPSLLRVSGVVDINQRCGDGTGAEGYIEAIEATGGSSLNICNASWGPNLGQLFQDTLAQGVPAYTLSQPAVAETLEVAVNGVVTPDVVLEEDGLHVSVASPVVVEGDTVEITYSPRPTCD